jgi:hypothetical protein
MVIRLSSRMADLTEAIPERIDDRDGFRVGNGHLVWSNTDDFT